MSHQEMALLLAEGETAKAKALNEWLDTEHRSGSIDARVILWRTYFAHRAAAERYLEIARTAGVVVDGHHTFRTSHADSGQEGSDA